MTTTPAPERQLLSFAWTEEKRRSLLLPAFILLSLIGHAATFFLFQVTYPQQVTIPAPTPTVSVLDPNREDHQAILRWVASADPALTAISSTAEPKGLLEMEYHPSFTTPRTPLRFIPAESDPVRFPPVLDTATLLRRVQPLAQPTAPPLPKAETRLAISGPLAGRTLMAGFQAQASVETIPQSTTFFVGVGADGIPKYSFPQHTAGQTALEQAAAAGLQGMRFAPADEEITWGMVTIEWGDEVFVKHSKEAKAP